MAITYRGVPQADIAESLEKLALRLLALDIGPRCTALAEYLLAPDGTAAQIRMAATKPEIEAALHSIPEGASFDVTACLSKLYRDLFPSVFAKADQAHKISLVEEIGAVMGWNGFAGQSRLPVPCAEDREIADYCRQQLGIDADARQPFKQGVFRGAYMSYDVHCQDSVTDTIAAISAYAKANGMEDECGGVSLTRPGEIYLTHKLAGLVLTHVPQCRALTLNGSLLPRADAPARKYGR